MDKFWSETLTWAVGLTIAAVLEYQQQLTELP